MVKKRFSSKIANSVINIISLGLIMDARTVSIKITGIISEKESRFTPCREDSEGGIVSRWIKTNSKFMKIDALDPNWLATGVLGMKKQVGCRVLKPNTWYWMGFMSTRVSSNQCELKTTLWQEGIPDEGSCDGVIGKGIWEQLSFQDVQFYKQGKAYNFSVTAGAGQMFIFNKSPETLNTTHNLGWLVAGMKAYTKSSHNYLNHYGSNLKQNLIELNEFSYGEFYRRATASETQGISVDSNPFKFRLRSGGGELDTFGISEEVLITRASDFQEGGISRALMYAWEVITETGLLVFSASLKFQYTSSPMTGTISVGLEISYETTTHSDSTTLSGIANLDHISVLLSFSVTPDKGVYNNMMVNPVIKIEAGGQNTQFETTQLRTVGNSWALDLISIHSVKCLINSSPTTDCSTTHNFDVVLSSETSFMGFWERSKIPASLWVSNDPGHDQLCWIPGISNPIYTNTSCTHCKTVKDRNTDGSFTTYIQREDSCEPQINTILSPSLSNCQIGKYKSTSCDKCSPGFAVNLNRDWIGPQTTTCISDSACKAGLPQIAFEQKSYGTITRKFCTSCPHNCLSCNTGMECSQCTSQFSLLNSETKRCDCKVSGCMNCTFSDCDICSSNRAKHIHSNGTVTCDTRGCLTRFGKLPGEVIPAYYSPRCRSCSDPNCANCKSDYRKCDRCDQEMGIPDAESLCKLIPSCRSPFVVNSSNYECRDCSKEFEQLEKIQPGFCSMTKSFNFMEVKEAYPENEKKRRFRLDCEHFNEDFPLTNSLLNNLFKIRVVPNSSLQYSITTQKNNLIEFEFSQFLSGGPIQLSFRLKNSTIEEEYVDQLKSKPIKTLQWSDMTYVFNIFNQETESSTQDTPNDESQNNTNEITSVEKTTETSGEAVGQTGRVVVTLSTASVLLGSKLSADVSGSMLKGIQFILVFDKLRLIKVNLDGLLGRFMKAVYEAFQFNFIEKDDFHETTNMGENKLSQQRIQAIAYRRKLDKYLIYSLCVVFDMLIHFAPKFITKNPKKFKRVEIVCKTLEVLDRVRFGFTLLSIIDVMFYAGHQLLHQRGSSLRQGSEYLGSYLWSLVLFSHSVYSILVFIRRFYSFSVAELEKPDSNGSDKGSSEGGLNREKMQDSSRSNKKRLIDHPSERNRNSLPNKLEGGGPKHCPNRSVTFRKFREFNRAQVVSMRELLHIKNRSKRNLFQKHQGVPFSIEESPKKEEKEHSFDVSINFEGEKEEALPESETRLRKYSNDKNIHERTHAWGKPRPSQRDFEEMISGSSTKGPSPSSPKINLNKTISNFILGSHYKRFIMRDIDKDHIEGTPRTYNLLYTLNICLICIPILVLQSVPPLQICSIALGEGLYRFILCSIKHKVNAPVSTPLFWLKFVESFCVLGFVLYCGFDYLFRAKEWAIQTYFEFFVLGCFIVIILVSIGRLVYTIFCQVWNFYTSTLQFLCGKNNTKTNKVAGKRQLAEVKKKEGDAIDPRIIFEAIPLSFIAGSQREGNNNLFLSIDRNPKLAIIGKNLDRKMLRFENRKFYRGIKYRSDRQRRAERKKPREKSQTFNDLDRLRKR